MVERGGRLCFLHEALARLVVARQLVWEKLERDVPVEPGVERPVNDAHTAAAELLEDLVVGEFLAFHRHPFAPTIQPPETATIRPTQ